jgi:hypothetical protein
MTVISSAPPPFRLRLIDFIKSQIEQKKYANKNYIYHLRLFMKYNDVSLKFIGGMQ